MSTERLLVSVFDVHLWTKLLDPSLLVPELAFLGDAAAYRTKREAGKELQTLRLILFPIISEPDRNHFWPRYLDAAFVDASLDPAVAGPQDLLIPLRCRPKSLDLKFLGPGLQHPVKVWATIWLWSFGWSSAIEFEVKGALDFDSVRAIHEALRSAKPFVLDGKPASLPAVFQSLGAILREDVAKPGKLPTDLLRVPRQIVLAFWRAKCAPDRRYESDGTKTPVWSDSERVRMHGALRGEALAIDKLNELDPPGKPRQYLLTSLGGSDFAITHYDKGTLAVRRHWSDVGRTRSKSHCLTANMRNFSIVTQALIALIADHTPTGEEAPRGELAVSAKALLERLAKFYRNPFCAGFLARHSALQ